jgi:chromosome segregation ATPase
MRAEEEKKAREQELAAAKAQVEELKKTLHDNINRTAEMQRHLYDAQEKERAALEQLNTAIRQANELSAQAEQARQNAEAREEVILTFKNKDGKVLEIKNLDELSEDKLRALGFDVEILKR